VQTFMPYADLVQSARCLDDRRLGKQRSEAMQILNALRNPANRWRRHPAVRMWAGYEGALTVYMNACIDEWMRRGYVNNMERGAVVNGVVPPPWLGDERLHSSHRASLLRKDAKFYGRYGWDVDLCLPYFWPEGPVLPVTHGEERAS
jgi:hypothetical protein